MTLGRRSWLFKCLGFIETVMFWIRFRLDFFGFRFGFSVQQKPSVMDTRTYYIVPYLKSNTHFNVGECL